MVSRPPRVLAIIVAAISTCHVHGELPERRSSECEATRYITRANDSFIANLNRWLLPPKKNGVTIAEAGTMFVAHESRGLHMLSIASPGTVARL
jgi:hypothetical protein